MVSKALLCSEWFTGHLYVVTMVFCLVVRWFLGRCYALNGLHVVARVFCLVVRWFLGRCYALNGLHVVARVSVWLLGDAMVLCCC